MIVCPVCENQQEAGSECAVCGRRLVEGRGTDAPVAPIEGLEQTALDASGAAVVPEPMLDLEVTRFEPTEAPLLSEVVPDFEQTRTEPVEVEPDVTPDVERVMAGLPEDGPTPLALVVTCRYCRTEAAPGERICGRCGMRLQIPLGPAPEAAGASDAVRLCSCGTPVTRSRCPNCGARNAVP